MKQNITTAINFMLGLIGLFLMGIGYILTLGQLGLMGGTSYRAVHAGNMYGSIESALLFILLPALLVKYTLGRTKKPFNFSSGLIIFMFVFAATLGTVAEIGKTYNYLVSKDEIATKVYKDINIQYVKKFELAAQLAEASKTYMEYESSTLQAIVDSRNIYNTSRELNTKIDAANSFEDNLRTLVVNVENYPDLKASETVEKYMNELIVLENELANSKKNYNREAMEFNSKYREFPTVVIAKFLGFEPKVYFDTEEQ